MAIEVGVPWRCCAIEGGGEDEKNSNFDIIISINLIGIFHIPFPRYEKLSRACTLYL
jgi:hypothetical protein